MLFFGKTSYPRNVLYSWSDVWKFIFIFLSCCVIDQISILIYVALAYNHNRLLVIGNTNKGMYFLMLVYSWILGNKLYLLYYCSIKAGKLDVVKFVTWSVESSKQFFLAVVLLHLIC